MAGEQITRLYSGFRGVDFRGEECNLSRSPDSLNVWRNYKHSGSIETRPDLKCFYKFDTTTIYCSYPYRDIHIIHAGESLYKLDKDGNMTEIRNGLNGLGLSRKRGIGFVFGDNFYYLCNASVEGEETINARFLKYDGETVIDIIPYIPTTSIGGTWVDGKGAVAGTKNEDVNLLIPRRKNSFYSDSLRSDIPGDFMLDAPIKCSITDVKITMVIWNGKVIPESNIHFDISGEEHYRPGYNCYKKTSGEIVANIFHSEQIDEAPTVGKDNVIIEYEILNSAEANTNRAKIMECTLAQVFDNRVFFSGNPNYPNYVWHCSLNDVSYFSDLDYYIDGSESAAIRGMVAGNNSLWVLREPSPSNTNVFYHIPSLDDDYGKIYPSSHSSIALGCVGAAINFNDDIVFFSERGMEGVSGDISSEQFVAHRSSLIDRLLTVNESYREMILCEWEGYLCVFVGNECFLADSRAVFTNENHIEYEWYHWQFADDIKVKSAYNIAGNLHLISEDGRIFILDEKIISEGKDDIDQENQKSYISYWTTPKDKFNTPHKLKTTNKKGCVIEASGSVKVYAKTNEEESFELIESFEDIQDHIVCSIKKKKFKDIRLKFESDSRFSLESATLETIVGGYIK